MALPPVPTILADSIGDDSAVEAVYYTVRVLRNAARGYGSTPVSPESSEKAHTLAEATVREIEAREGISIPALESERLSEYIQVLEAFLQERYGRAGSESAQRVEGILDELRVANP